jgi:KEOPS complex subunit Pcc1
MPRATLHFDSHSPQDLLRALGPELGREIPKTRVDGLVEKGRVVLDIEATDLSALRAAINSYLRWVKITKDIEEFTGV